MRDDNDSLVVNDFNAGRLVVAKKQVKDIELTPVTGPVVVETVNGTSYYYVIRNGRIDDAEWTWSYAGKKKYARAEFYLGFQLLIIKPQELPVIN